MKIKVGDKIYDGTDEPIMIILENQDKENIKNMPQDLTQYCIYPSFMNIDEVSEFMGIILEEKNNGKSK